MTIDRLKGALPSSAKDIKLNLSSVVDSTILNETQIWGTMLASAFAARNPVTTEAIADAAAPHLTPEAIEAAKAAASVMAMNNVYYRAVHLMGDPEYARMPARLRMNIIASPGIEKLDFELFCLAVSAINGCGRCLESHAHEIAAKGANRQAVQEALRIAAVVHATACAIESQEAFAKVPA